MPAAGQAEAFASSPVKWQTEEVEKAAQVAPVAMDELAVQVALVALAVQVALAALAAD